MASRTRAVFTIKDARAGRTPEEVQKQHDALDEFSALNRFQRDEVKGIDSRFWPEPGPNKDNRLNNLEQARAVASAIRSKNLFDLLHKDAFAGARVWLVGGGPSAKDFDFSILKGEIVLAANRAMEHAPTSMVCFMDKPFVRTMLDGKLPGNGQLARRKWLDFKGPKVAIVPRGAAICQVDDVPYYCIPSDCKRLDTGTPQPCIGLNHCNNTGLSMLKLAWGLGAKEIHLIGYDLLPDEDGLKDWFHAGYEDRKLKDDYHNMIERFEEIVGLLNEDGVQVLNHNPNSGLSCFPKVPLPTEKLVSRSPLVVGFYTLGTPYEEEIKGMERSFTTFGFEVLTEGIPSRRTWTENCYHKPTFLREMMEANPNRVIIWSDADGICRRYPKELIDLLESGKDFDIATSFTDWSKVNKLMMQSRGTNRKAISSAFIVINCTEGAYKIVCEWEKRCKDTLEKYKSKENAGTPPVDDLLLEDVYYAKKQWRSAWVQLPPGYAQIFDLAQGAGVPVVEQMQASRRFKKVVNSLPDEFVANNPAEFIHIREKQVYDTLWKSGEYVDSQTAKKFMREWSQYITTKETVLEVGCGSGSLLRELRSGRVDVRGYDISGAGVVSHNPEVLDLVQEGPLWELPYADDSFDHILSIDVLEHLPSEYVEPAIREMMRVARHRMTHVIATFSDVRNGVVVHKTVQPISWWIDMFKGLVPRGKGMDLQIMDRKAYLKKG